MRTPTLGRLTAIRDDARAVGRAVGHAMKRPSTYPAFAREMLTAGVNLAFYPAGVLSEVLKLDEEVRFPDRFTRQEPLRYLDPEAASTPIILLHGYFHNRSAFVVMRRHLKRAGFRTVDTMNYRAMGHDIPELAQELSVHVDEVLEAAGATQVHLVGHSLGGLVARYYIQMLGGAERVHTCVTLGTPHQGTFAAWIGRGKAVKQLRPGSKLLSQLKHSVRATSVRFVSIYSNIDAAVLPPSHAKLVEPVLHARNVLVKDLGHMSLLISKPLIRSIAQILSSLEAETSSLRDAADSAAS